MAGSSTKAKKQCTKHAIDFKGRKPKRKVSLHLGPVWSDRHMSSETTALAAHSQEHYPFGSPSQGGQTGRSTAWLFQQGRRMARFEGRCIVSQQRTRPEEKIKLRQTRNWTFPTFNRAQSPAAKGIVKSRNHPSLEQAEQQALKRKATLEKRENREEPIKE